MSAEERFLNQQERDRERPDPHDAGATLYDNERFADAERHLRAIQLPRDPAPDTLEAATDRFLAIAMRVKNERDEARRQLELIREHCADFDRPMFTEHNRSLKIFIDHVREAVERGLR